MAITFHLTAECYHSECLSKMYDMQGTIESLAVTQCIGLPVPQVGGQSSLLLKRVIRETSTDSMGSMFHIKQLSSSNIWGLSQRVLW